VSSIHRQFAPLEHPLVSPGPATAAEYYERKVATVTGAASGIGLALAETLLSYGAGRVVLADVNHTNLEREAARLEAAYPRKTLAVRCDVTDEEDVQSMIRRAAAFGDGRVDLLFNNAGAGFGGRFDALENEDWQKGFALNFYGALYGIRAVLPIMRAQGGGHIVDVISGIAFAPMAGGTVYAATKAALNGLTLALRYELWDENIRFTSATPGLTATAIFDGVGGPPAGAQSPQQAARTILAGVAENRRLVLGDEGDVHSASKAFAPEEAESMDRRLLEAARARRGDLGAV